MTWDWIAGFFDAEGCVLLVSRKRASGARYYYPRLVLTQNRRWLLEQVRQFVGGGAISVTHRDNANGPVYQLRWEHHRAVAIAERLEPLCILKTPQLRTLREAMRFEGTARRGFDRLLRTQKRDLGEDGPLPPSHR